MTAGRPLSFITLLALGATSAMGARHVSPVLVPGPTGGHETHKAGSYFGYPPADEVSVVAAAVDRGASFSAPTDYPPERHVAYSPGMDTYFVAYEWNEAQDFMIATNYWQEVGGIGFWSFPGTPSESTQDDAGRPSLCGNGDGMALAYHAVASGSDFQVYFNQFDGATQSWGESVAVAPEIPSTNFPHLCRSADGTWMIVCDKGPISDPAGDVVVFTSTDGTTWAESVVQPGVITNWTLPTGAADPSNGDLYVAYSDDTNGDNYADIAIHRSTDGGQTWSTQQTVAAGAAGQQNVVPSIVVDQNHLVHLIYQRNISEDYTSGGLAGMDFGIAGPPRYVVGTFVTPDQWVTQSDEAMLNREYLTALPDSCEMEPTISNIATDTLTGIPQLGIERHPGGDRLYAAYTQFYMATAAAEGGWLICGPTQVWTQTLDTANGKGWSERHMVSAITIEQSLEDRNAIYVGITQDIPDNDAGAGYVWSEMNAAAPPSDVFFVRHYSPVGIQGGDPPGAPALATAAVLHPAAPNPFNPMTWISYDLPAATEVSLTVYDATGKQVRVLQNGRLSAGSHRATWDGSNEQGGHVASGVYFYRLETELQSSTRSMVLVK
jgi:hypothetical protein